MSDSASVAVVGVGSVGGYYAAKAAACGHQVTLCVRTPFDRLLVQSEGAQIAVDAEVRIDPSEVGVHDWVLLAVKAHQTEAAAPWLEALCGHATVVVVLQNGVEHVERVAPLVGRAQVLPAVVRYGGEATAPGRITAYTLGNLIVPDGDAGRRLVDLLAGCEAGVTMTPNFEEEAWSKLVTNVAANAILALTVRRLPVIRRPDIAELARGLMLECVAVARAEGVELDPGIVESEIDRLASLGDNVGSSMLYDRVAGRALEYDALNGAVVRIGRRHGVATPLNSAVVALLAAISEGDSTSDPDSICQNLDSTH